MHLSRADFDNVSPPGVYLPGVCKTVGSGSSQAMTQTRSSGAASRTVASSLNCAEPPSSGPTPWFCSWIPINLFADDAAIVKETEAYTTTSHVLHDHLPNKDNHENTVDYWIFFFGF